MQRTHIRQAILSDAEALAALSSQLGYACTADDMKARLSAVFPSADHVIYVYCDDRTAPSAWLHVMRTFHLESGFAAEIAGLVVNESQRGRGIGAALVAEAIGWARAEGLTSLKVRSRTERPGAHRFYQRLGFSPSKLQQVFELPLSQITHYTK